MTEQPTPPLAPQKTHVETRHGTTVADPFFWLREKDNPEVTAYLEAENRYTEISTSHLRALQEKLYAEMLGRIQQTDVSVPVKRGDFFYYTRFHEGEQYPVRCRRRGSMDAPEQVLLDLNEMAAGKPFISLGDVVVSEDHNLLAYTIDFSGFRQFTLQIKDLRTGDVLSDTADRVTSFVWASDNRTVLYSTEDEVTKRSDSVWRHALGGQHERVLHEPDEMYDVDLRKTRDQAFLFIQLESKDTNEFRFLSASHPTGNFQTFLPRRKKHRYYPDHHENQFLIRTNRNGINFELVTTPDTETDEQNWTVLVPHRDDVLLEDVDVFKNFFVVVELSRALAQLKVHSFAHNTVQTIRFPEPVYSVHPHGNAEWDTATYRYLYESFTTPDSVYEYHVESASSTLLKRKQVPAYDPERYASERLWIRARDGADIPVSIVYPKTFVRDSQAPLLLYGYGSYGISIPVTFNSDVFSLLDRGYAYAIAHIRGGSDLGEKWREDGMLLKKKNTFNDFIDVAQWLVDNGWTSPSKLEIEGRSAGGLLMGAVVNQRPDLFRAAHLGVPFLDVMNTMLDSSLPLTVGEYLEWGDPNDQSYYDYMLSYSPYDNLTERKYPAMLVTTSLNDSQVMYWEPAKYVAKLRTLKTDANDLLLKIKMEPAGHGGASGRYDRLRDKAFEYAWFLHQVGITT